MCLAITRSVHFAGAVKNTRLVKNGCVVSFLIQCYIIHVSVPLEFVLRPVSECCWMNKKNICNRSGLIVFKLIAWNTVGRIIFIRKGGPIIFIRIIWSRRNCILIKRSFDKKAGAAAGCKNKKREKKIEILSSGNHFRTLF